MEAPYIDKDDFLDLAFTYLRKANVFVTEDDVDSLAGAMATACFSWFGDMKHLIPKPTDEQK